VKGDSTSTGFLSPLPLSRVLAAFCVEGLSIAEFSPILVCDRPCLSLSHALPYPFFQPTSPSSPIIVTRSFIPGRFFYEGPHRILCVASPHLSNSIHYRKSPPCTPSPPALCIFFVWMLAHLLPKACTCLRSLESPKLPLFELCAGHIFPHAPPNSQTPCLLEMFFRPLLSTVYFFPRPSINPILL